MVEFSKVKEGDTLYDIHRRPGSPWGEKGVWVVRVLRVDAENRRAWCSWNGNPAAWWDTRKLSRLRRNRPQKKG